MDKHKELEKLRLMLVGAVKIVDKLLVEYRTPIECLEISSRAKNSLYRGGIKYVQQLYEIELVSYINLMEWEQNVLKK